MAIRNQDAPADRQAIIKYLSKTKDSCYFKSLSHAMTSRYMNILNNFLTMPLIVLVGATGSPAFMPDDESDNSIWTLILGYVSIFSAIIMALTRYLNLDIKSQKHMHLSFMHASIYRKISYFINKQTNCEELIDYMNIINFKINTIENMEIFCPKWIDAKAEKKIDAEKSADHIYFSKQTAMKANQYNGKQIKTLALFDVEILRKIAHSRHDKGKQNNLGSVVNIDIETMDKNALLNFLVIDLNLEYNKLANKAHKKRPDHLFEKKDDIYKKCLLDDKKLEFLDADKHQMEIGRMIVNE